MPHKGLTMLEINADIPQETVKAFEDAFTRFHTVLGNGMGTAIRRGFSALCRSLIAKTKVAPKLVPQTSVTSYTGSGPHYLTPKGKRQKAQHRYSILRREKSEDSWAYAKAAKSAEQARKRYGKIKKAGLAKQSWSVARALIASRNGNIKHGLAKGGDVRGYVREYVTGPNQRVEALLENNLKYITAATPEAVVDDAMRSATRTIEAIINDKLNEGLK